MVIEDIVFPNTVVYDTRLFEQIDGVAGNVMLSQSLLVVQQLH